MKLFRNSFLLTSLLFVVNFCYADFYALADLSYTCKGNNKYDVKLVIYAECGTPSKKSDLNLVSGYDVIFGSDSLKLKDLKLEVLKVGNPAGEEIKLFCDKFETKCANFDSPNRSLRKYTFQAELDLSKYQKARDWRIYWRRDTRSVYNINLNLPDRFPFYVEARLNNKDFDCNNSVTFGSSPVISSCINQTNNYQLLATDADGDSLKYSLVSPKNDIQQDVVYKSGFSATRPMNLAAALTITKAGSIAFTPTKNLDVGITDIQIEEYRGGKLVSSLTRGIQISSFNCTNNKPVISGIAGTNNTTLTFCVGDTMTPKKTTFTVTDIDATDDVAITVKSGLNFFTGTNAYTKNPTAFINNIVVTPDLPLTNTIVIEAIDNGCPIPQKTTKTFTINFKKNPNFDLGNPITQKCSPPNIISPVFSPKDNKPYTYKWFEWSDLNNNVVIGKTLSTDSTFSTSAILKYGLVVTDKFGCKAQDTASIKDGIEIASKVDKRCFKDSTEIVDLSFSSAPLDSITWKIKGINTVFVGKELKYVFPAPGIYELTHTIKNKAGCTKTEIKGIEICKPPVPKFIVTDSCLQSPKYIDFSDYIGVTCREPETRFFTDSVLNPFTKKMVFIDTVELARGGTTATAPWPQLSFDFNNDNVIDVKDTGTYSIKMELKTIAGCIVDTFKTIPIFSEPQIVLTALNPDILLDPIFSLNCIDPDSILYTKVIKNNTKSENYFWYKYFTDENGVLLSSDPGDLGKKNFQLAGGVGEYFLRFEDGRGCDDTASVFILNNIKPEFTYSPVCYPNKSMKLKNNSDLGTANATFKKFIWNFYEVGSSVAFDSIITKTKIDVDYEFPQKKDYDVSLTVIDNSSCRKELRKTVYNTGFKDIFDIIPDFRAKPICSKDQITGKVVAIPDNGAHHIDSIFWDFGTGTGYKAYSFQTDPIVYFYYLDTNVYTVKAKVKYNSHPSESIVGCETQLPTWTQEIGIKPEFSGTFFPFRKCISDTSVFLFVKDPLVGDSTVKIKKIDWLITSRNDAYYNDIFNPVVPNNVTKIVQDQFEFTHYFTNDELSTNKLSTSLYAWYKAEDENGCIKANKEPVDINTPLSPVVTNIDTACFGFPSSITFQSSGLAIVDTDYGVEQGSTTLAEGPLTSYTSPVTVTAVMPQPATNGVEIYLVQKTKLNKAIKFNGKPLNESECRGVVDTTIYVRPSPNFDVTINSTCGGKDTSVFINNTKFNLKSNPVLAGDTNILGWEWDFGDGTKSTVKSPKHLYATGGLKKVSLKVKTTKCEFEYKKDLFVYPTPRPNFYFDSIKAEAGIDIEFENKTVDTNIVKYNWSFGDGAVDSTKDLRSVFHTYNAVGRFPVTLAATNTYGCTGSITKIVDTDSRLDLPTAFSPNGDGLNDQLPLIYKLVPQLLEFKIYNRWGQLVFDGGTDITSTWDGKFKGTDQEMGVYVAYVKAKGKYNKEYNFKRNVTLLR